MRNNFCYLSHAVCGILLWCSELTKTVTERGLLKYLIKFIAVCLQFCQVLLMFRGSVIGSTYLNIKAKILNLLEQSTKATLCDLGQVRIMKGTIIMS